MDRIIRGIRRPANVRKIQKKLKCEKREDGFRIIEWKYDFPDTDGVVAEFFDDDLDEDAAAVDKEVEVDELEESDEGTKSMRKNLVILYIFMFNFYSLSLPNRNIHATNRVLQYALCS